MLWDFEACLSILKMMVPYLLHIEVLIVVDAFTVYNYIRHEAERN